MTNPSDERLRSDLASLRIQGEDRERKKPSTSTNRWIFAALALVAVVVLVWFFSGTAPEVRVAYATVAAQGSNAGTPLLSGSGYVVTGDRYVSIGARIPGRIERYFVEEGQRVRAGDELVQLDDRDYRATLRSAEASLAVAQANLELARAELERARSLRAEKIISDQEFDIQNNRAAVSEATVAQLQAQVEQARVNLEHTVLRAPSDGVVLAKFKEVGEIAVPGGFAGSGDLVRLANLSDMRAELDVNEADLTQIRLGGAARVTPDAYPDVDYEAKVVKLYPQINRQKGTLRVEVRLDEPDDRLLPDMSARITFLAPASDEDLNTPDSSVWVPAQAVRSAEGESFVWVVEEGRAQRVPVRVADRSGGRVRLSEGLAGGEAVVTSSEELTEDQAVTTTAGN